MVLNYWPKNFIENFFPTRFFQITKDRVVVNYSNSGGSSTADVGLYTPVYDTDEDGLFKSLDLRFPKSKLKMRVNDLMVKVNNDQDKNILLSLLHLNFSTKEEQHNNNLVELLIQLVENVEKKEKNTIEEEEDLKVILDQITELNN